MEQNLISLRDVYFAYSPDKPLLNGVNLDIAKGKITAIMGGSGSGKTTLLRLISKQIKAQSGLVRVFGHNVDQINYRQTHEMRKRMGLLFQFGALFSDMNVEQNVAFPLQEHTKLPQHFIQRIVAMKLESVGLTGTQAMMPNELSGGMARRVALARAMALDPELMLYDEPFTGLDPISLNTTAMLIKKINDSLGQTSILVTHDIDATMRIADYLYFMSNGVIIARGTPEEIQRSSDPALQQFVKGEVNGPFAYKYPSKLSYAHYLGCL